MVWKQLLRIGQQLFVWLTLAATLLSFAPHASAQSQAPFGNTLMTAISLGGAYSQDFDALASSSTSSTVPTGWAFYEAGNNANTTYTAGTGSSNGGDTYSFGTSGSSERAFGGLLSSNLNPTIGAEFTNNTGATIVNLAISYYCEQWRTGVANRGAADRMDFQYSLNATSLTTGDWIDVNGLDCLTTDTSDPTGAKNGNAADYRTQVSGNITGLNIANAATFWLRWTDYDITNSDDGLAIDDSVVSP